MDQKRGYYSYLSIEGQKYDSHSGICVLVFVCLIIVHMREPILVTEVRRRKSNNLQYMWNTLFSKYCNNTINCGTLIA